MVIESLRRIIQIVFGIEIFEFPGLNRMRNFFYRLVFSIGKNPIIGKGVRLYRVHGITSGNIVIGNRVLLANNVHIDYVGGVRIEDDVWLSESVHIHTHQHLLTKNRTQRPPEEIIPAGLTIEEKVWMGDGAIILPTVHRIGKNAIIGAGSIVTRDIPANTIWAGNPARKIKDLALDDD
jgi:acetyltransferase-like isoleucine patch superfamily enzyme